MWRLLSIALSLILASVAAAVWVGYDLRTLRPRIARVTFPQRGEHGGAAPVTNAGEPDEKSNETGKQTPDQEASQGNEPQDDATAQWAEYVRQASETLASGTLDEAERHLDSLANMDLASREPQSDRLADLRQQLENLRRLRSTVAQLVTDDPEQVQAAENLLFERVDEALPLLEQALRGDDITLACPVMETLQRLKRPDVTLPMFVDVLRRPEQASCWPEAIRQIELAESGGVGDPLLELALAAESPEQRIAAFEALALCVDPPPHTVLALLPLLYADGPELAAALRAARSAVVVHDQTDLWLQWAADGLSPEQTERLFNLTERLRQITEGSQSEESAEVVQAARELAVALHQLPAEPLTGVKLAAYGAENDDGRAANVLDANWDTIDPRQMWRYSTTEPHSIVLDLGAERTVVGVRIWNLNGPQEAAGGWKQVAVYIGSSAAELTGPVANGIVPQGPATKNAPDYGTTIPVRFARGRYVRLVAESLWSQKQLTGLTEVQVLGF